MSTPSLPDAPTGPAPPGIQPPHRSGPQVPTDVTGLCRFGIKIAIRPATIPDPHACIPIFHRWIREKALGGLLIDVADYAHLVDGPRVLLVGHEGNLSLDFWDGEVGLLYTGKRPAGATLAERLTRVARTVLAGAHLLQSDESVDPTPDFDSGRLEFVANDRLLCAPTSVDDVVTLLRPHLTTLATSLYGTTPEPPTVTPITSDADRVRVEIRSSDRPSLQTLLERAT